MRAEMSRPKSDTRCKLLHAMSPLEVNGKFSVPERECILLIVLLKQNRPINTLSLTPAYKARQIQYM